MPWGTEPGKPVHMGPENRLRVLWAEILRVAGARSLVCEGLAGAAWTLSGQVSLVLGWGWGWKAV